MVNYHDTVVVARDYSILSKLWHAVAGLYFWEFVTTLDYEWSAFRRHRPFRWTMWIYFTTRIATLTDVVLFLVNVDVTTRYNCKIETTFLTTFASLATVSSSLLIVLRIFAIWNMNKIAIAIAASAWGAGFIFQIQTIARIRVESIPGKATCVIANPHVINLDILSGFTADIILMFIMFIGLFRLRYHKSSAFGMGRLLWRQALVWLLVAIIADTILVVFICLNLNGPLDNILLAPWVITTSIAATRIHRGLVDYASAGSTEQLSDLSHKKPNSRAERKANRVPITFANFTQVSRMEVAIPKMHMQDEALQTGQHGSGGSFIDVEGQLYENFAGQAKLHEIVENGGGFATESPTT